MKILKFKLSGQFAFFKNPEVNSNCYFTFNNIHKIALIGIFGSILGLKGYNQQRDAEYPEFYDKLNDLKVSIVPKNNVCPNKKIQQFNNCTMFYNKGSDLQGANLIVKEEWIENPCWEIYIQINESKEIEKELLSRIVESRYVYTPYLGKNDHFANITDVVVFDEDKIKLNQEPNFILDSFYAKEDFAEVKDDFFSIGDNILRYREYLPYKLTSETNHYEYKVIEYSTSNIKPIKNNTKIYFVNGINITFL